MTARADAFPEYDQLLALFDAASHVLDCRVVCEAEVQGHRFGVHVASLGSRDPQAPAIGIFGGIHGLDCEDEDIRVIVEPADRALERLARGGIDSAIAVVALQWLALNRARLRAQWT